MTENPSERRARKYLVARGFRVERFSKGETRLGKTPDFRVFSGGDFSFFCEVKAVEYDRWLDGLIDQAPPGTIVGGGRSDPVFNRITDDIHQAVKQFDAVNPQLQHPNVLIFANEKGSHCDIMTLLAALTGYFFADSGERFPIYRNYSHGRIRKEKIRVHLYIWLDPDGHDYKCFTIPGRQHEMSLCRWFGVGPSALRRLDS